MRREPGFGRGDVGQVEAVDRRPRARRLDATRRFAQLDLVHVDKCDRSGTALGKRDGGGAADAARGPGNDGGFALDIHCSLPFDVALP
jgi:hypothetical protein